MPSAGVMWHGEPPTHLGYGTLETSGLRHAFTTRHHGGFDGLGTPDGRLRPWGPAFETLGVDPGRVRFARQVHGTACLAADAAAPGVVGDGDALVTTRPGHPLAVFTADCLAVLVTDPDVPLLAVAHAGWRGTVGGILIRLVRTLVADFGGRSDRFRVAIGPSIGPCCYEVDEVVVGPLAAAFPDSWDAWVSPRGPGKWKLDLWRANSDQLVQAGLSPDAIVNPRLCTACRRDLFFSYRREGPGRSLLALAVLG